MPRHRLRSPAAAAALLLLPVALGAAACGGADAAGPASQAAPSTTASRAGHARGHPTGPPGAVPAELAVRRAYLRSWDDYAHAVWTLDARGLDRAYARDGLADVERELDQRVALRRRSRVDVTHDVTVTVLGPTRAAVVDATVEASVDVDADTGADLEPRQPRPRYFQMVLERIDGVWKVVFTA